jgi:hypothetical protein
MNWLEVWRIFERNVSRDNAGEMERLVEGIPGFWPELLDNEQGFRLTVTQNRRIYIRVEGRVEHHPPHRLEYLISINYPGHSTSSHVLSKPEELATFYRVMAHFYSPEEAEYREGRDIQDGKVR